MTALRSQLKFPASDTGCHVLDDHVDLVEQTRDHLLDDARPLVVRTRFAEPPAQLTFVATRFPFDTTQSLPLGQQVGKTTVQMVVKMIENDQAPVLPT